MIKLLTGKDLSIPCSTHDRREYVTIKNKGLYCSNANNIFYAVAYGRDDGFLNGVEGKLIISNNGIDWFTAVTFPDYENYFRDIVFKN